MLRINALLALALSASLIAACSKEDKPEGKKKNETAAPVPTTPAEPNAAVVAPNAPTTPGPAKVAEPPKGGMMGMLAAPAEEPAQPGGMFGAGGMPQSMPGGEMDKKSAKRMPDQEPPPHGKQPMTTPQKKPGKKCSAAANKIWQMLWAQMSSTMKPDQRKAMKKQSTVMIARLAGVCEKQKWTAAMHGCINSAKAVAELKKCEKFAPKKPGKRPDLNKVPDKPVSSGNAQCDATAKHVVHMLMTQTPPAQRKQMVKMKVKLQNMLSKKCADEKWPASIHSCVKNAKDLKALEKCNPKKPPAQ